MEQIEIDDVITQEVLEKEKQRLYLSESLLDDQIDIQKAIMEQSIGLNGGIFDKRQKAIKDHTKRSFN